jgi:Spy/CpxP family protein refolding chaperone
MTIDRRAIVAALALSFLFASAPQAAPKHHGRHSHHSWDGTWSGHWGGSAAQATSITIANNKVVSYTYQGASTPVSASAVTPTKASYESNGVRVVLTRTGSKTANASLHSSHGNATARLTRQ